MADSTPAARSSQPPVSPVPVRERDRLGAPLPTPLTSFVGREREVEQVCALLRRADVRLVTLTGPGGVGKTRLALRAAEVAPAFADGVAFVDLTPLTDPDLAAPAVAQALGVREAGDRPVAERLVDALRDRHLLLVLDNFEQIADAAPLVARLLGACSRVRALVTSREPLRLSAERVVAVPPLALPDPARPVEDLAAAEAVRLFVERAQAARADFVLTAENAPAIADVARRLDGLPLAIELAAARVAHLPPAALLARLERRLPLLTGGGRDLPERQRTLRDAITWSYDLLTPGERALFRRLAVFVGGFTLEAAEAVAERDGDALDGIASLVAKSLLRQAEDAEDEPRYRMLETVREFGLERLAEAGEEEAVRDAHADYMVAWAERAAPLIDGPEDGLWLARLERDHGNLRATLAWLERTGDAALLLRLAAALGPFWELAMHLTEGDAWLERALAAEPAPSPVRLESLLQCGMIAHYRGHHERGAERLKEAAHLARRLGSDRLATVLMFAGAAAADRGDYDRAEALQAEALAAARAAGDGNVEAFALAHLGVVAWGRGDPARATACLEAASAIGRAAGYPLPVEVAARYLAHVACDAGEFARAAEHFRDIVDRDRESAQVLRTIPGVAALAGRCGAADRAVRLFGAAEALGEATGLAPALPERAAYERAIARLRETLGERAFRSVWDAGRALSPGQVLAELEAALAAALAADPKRRVGEPGRDLDLTPREREVLALLVAGRSNPQIAEALFISPRTAQTHVTRILAKLGAATRAEAAALAVRDGLV